MPTATTECQGLIDEIKTVMSSLGAADVDLMREATAEYSEICSEVNSRLRVCEELLRKGLRSEALQEAERDPNVLDMVAVLDFPEHSGWCQMLEHWDLAVPPPLLMDVATALNEAYAEQKPLESLLKKHRLLALGRCPLKPRLTVLRQLQKADPGNLAWQEDLEQFESARLDQLGSEAEKAFKHGDLDTLLDLNKEIGQIDWFTEPPSDVTNRVRSWSGKVASEKARHDLADLEPKLNDAFAAFDIEKARSLREQWNHALAIARPSKSDPLLERTAPALEWLEEQEHHEILEQRQLEAIAELEQAIEDEEDREEIERLYYALVRFDLGVPEHVQQRYDDWIRHHDLTGKRRHRLRLFGIVGVLALSAAIIAVIIVQQQFRRQVAQSRGLLKELVSEERFAEAEEYYATLEQKAPKVAASEAVQNEIAELRAKINDENERREAFNTALSSAMEKGPANPNHDALDKAEELARLDSEKAKVAAFLGEIEALKNKQQKDVDERFLTRLAGLRKKLETVDLPSLNQQQIDELQALSAAIALERNPVSRPVSEQLSPLEGRIRKLSQHYATREKQRLGKAEITRFVLDGDSFAAALADYRKRHPETNTAVDFARSLEERDLWRGISEWEDFLSSSAITQPKSASPKLAKETLARGQDLLERFENIPLAKEFTEKVPYLEAISRREDDSGDPITGQLDQLFADPLLASIWMLETSDGGRLYMSKYAAARLERSRKTSTNRSVYVDYIVDFGMQEKKTTVAKTNIKSLALSPQAQLVASLRRELQAVGSNGWEKAYYQALLRIQAAKSVDPLIRFILAQNVLAIANEGSTFLEEAFAPHARRFEEARVDVSVNWVAPDDKQASVARGRAEAILSSLPSLSAAVAGIVPELKVAQEPRKHRYTRIGWLRRDSQGKWECAQADNRLTSDHGTLLVVARNQTSREAEFSEVGKLVDGNIELKPPSSTSALIEGRPVYLRTTISGARKK